MSVNLTTMKKWIQGLDSLGEWLRYDESGGNVTRIFCALCHTKHKERLHEIRNFSSSCIGGVSDTALKKDGAKKHQGSDMHAKAVNLE